MFGKKAAGLLAATMVAALVTTLLPVASLRAAPTQKDLDELATEISKADEEYNQARLDLKEVQNKVEQSERSKRESDEKLAVLRDRASKRAAAMYKMGAPAMLEMFLTADNPAEFSRRMAGASAITDWEAGLMGSLEIASQKAGRDTEDLNEALKKQQDINDSIKARQSQLQSQMARQRELLAQQRARDAAAQAAAARSRVPASQAAGAAAAVQAAAVAQDTPAPAKPAVAPPPPPASGSARTAVQAAYEMMGKPYRWGAEGPDSFDCSGLTMYAWAKAGVSLPHSSRAQFAATKRVSREDLQPGDLVFFGSPIHHVGMYVGDGKMINSPETGDTVGVRSMARRDYAGAGRPGI